MDLRENTNETYNEQYSPRPNPNDALFGGMGGSEPYQVTSTYTGSTYKKSGNGGAIIAVIVALLIVAVVAFFVTNNLKEKNKYNGYYEMTKASYMGVTMEIDQMEAMTNMTMEASLEIDGEYADMVINSNGAVQSGRCKITIEGASVTLEDSDTTMYGTYDEANKTITIETSGAALIFEKME